MFENIAALDIGSSSVKLITARTGIRDFKLMSLAYEDIDLTAENYEQELHNTLEKIFAENNLRGYRILTNIPMENVLIRNLSFPFSDSEKIAEVLPFEAADNLPYKLSDLIMDFQMVQQDKEVGGKVLLAATHKERIQDHLKILNEFGKEPIKMGLEANYLFECYRNFSPEERENIIQLDIGHNKTILNVCSDEKLIYTRCISIGLNHIYKNIAEMLAVDLNEAMNIFQHLNLDVFDYETNINQGFYSTLKISKPKLKKIFNECNLGLKSLCEQILFSIQYLRRDFPGFDCSRLLISGGGANIKGIGNLLSEELEIPVVDLPFIEDYRNETHIRTQFPIAFGMLMTYLTKSKTEINFLREEFTPTVVNRSRKQYYLAILFSSLAVIFLAIFLLSNNIFQAQIKQNNEQLLEQKFKSYFHGKDPHGDPIGSARKILISESKEIKEIETIIPTDEKVLDLMQDITSAFPQNETFKLKRLLINHKKIRIEGQLDSNKTLDEFKNNLLSSPKFSSVNMNSNVRGSLIYFSMSIDLKETKKRK